MRAASAAPTAHLSAQGLLSYRRLGRIRTYWQRPHSTGAVSRPQRYSYNDERDEGLASLRSGAALRKREDDVCWTTHEQRSNLKPVALRICPTGG
jgi:hypothetical protein